MTVSLATRPLLLRLARTAISNFLTGLDLPFRPALDAITEADLASTVARELDSPSGAFVTLHEREDGSLRGCIGVIETHRPLWETVRESAVSAATHDPRFAPVELQELPGLHIEISVLSPLQRTKDSGEVIVGVHGLFIRNDRRSGLLLPQVAPDWGWNREEFLAHTCRKAGLPMDAWQMPDTEIFIFTATVFGE